MKNQKGITMVSLAITVILFTVILATITFSSNSSMHLRRINNMYADINVVQSRINSYYLETGTLPTGSDVSSDLATKLGTNKNPNDNAEYKIIDLSKLGNLTLNNGGPNDSFAVNMQSHQVYYYNGVIASDDGNDVIYSAPFDGYVTIPLDTIKAQT